MGKKNPLSFRHLCLRRRTKKKLDPPTLLPPPPQPMGQSPNTAAAGGSVPGKGKKKAGGARLWMRFDLTGRSELVECDKSTIIERAGIPARDLRILGPVFSHSSNILAREKAMVVNLEFIKAIVTAEEVLLLDPLRQEVLPFVDQLRQQLPYKSPANLHGAGPADVHDSEMQVSTGGRWLPVPEAAEGLQCELPFEFQVLEIALEVVCTYLDSSVADLERDAYPVLDELARNVSTKNLEHVRSLKSNLTRLLARVQKVRDEIEHLLDDNEDMAHLYLTRKRIHNQQLEAGGDGSNSFAIVPHLPRLSSKRSGSLVSSFLDDNDVEDLEMLLEAYFMQLDGTRNKILSVREYIDDTEDYVNIQLDNQRNELIQLQLTLTIASFAIAFETLIAGLFGMNIPCTLYKIHGIFEIFVGSLTAARIGCTLAMANSKSSSNFRNAMFSGKHSLLPPKSPFPSVSAYADYAPAGVLGPKAVPKPREGNIHHQRTSSESFLLEEQPSWLDDLLNEPETPVRRGGHRRSSSDSFAYIDVISSNNIEYAAPDEYRYKNLVSMPSWASQEFDYLKDVRHAPYYAEANSAKPKNRAWESPVNALTHPSSIPSARENAVMQNAGSTGATQEADGHPSTASEKLETAEADPHDPKLSSEKKDNSHVKTSASETDTKRAKQQFAQRSRVRKLQYIAELERNVQALQAEGSGFSAELEFLNQQNLILSMENKALKQRLESLAQEQLIKCLEQEVLEREIGRLRALYGQQQHHHQHQQHKPPSSSHRRNNSRDLDSQFANLSLKHKDANSGHDSVTGPLRI
ncbi:hypothetical protein Dsin_032139 [Dipteronia sinensis]|uniref:Putative magnesium transporter MRS2-H n=1 Tax=Dipteronia sinensis TaxID=43782 RepID=A0AAD9ZMI4_9ROSI|nr:hypothetical protein Dsin_032139 [Dipteronia sinensis]